MNETVLMLMGVTANLLLIAGGAFYVFRVLRTYAREGAGYRLHLEWGGPARSAERLLIWAGIKVILAVLWAVRSVLNVLYQASADVGTWVVSKSDAHVQARILSRIL